METGAARKPGLDVARPWIIARHSGCAAENFSSFSTPHRTQRHSCTIPRMYNLEHLAAKSGYTAQKRSGGMAAWKETLAAWNHVRQSGRDNNSHGLMEEMFGGGGLKSSTQTQWRRPLLISIYYASRSHRHSGPVLLVVRGFRSTVVSDSKGNSLEC